MRKLCDASSPAEARRIVDGLLVDGIEAQIRGDDAASVWVIEHGDLERARTSVQTRADQTPTELAKGAAARRREQERELEDHAQRRMDLGARWRGVQSSPGPVTLALIAGSVIIALMGLLADADADPMWSLTIDRWDTIVPLQAIRDGEVWRLVTPMFLHFGLFHLVFNMMWLWQLGPQVESNHGSLYFIVLVLVAEIAGNLAQYFVSGPAFGGMSGVVYALFGFVWMRAQYDRRHRYALSDTNAALIMVWFVLCATGFVGPIANLGHAGGLVIGLLFGLPPYIRQVRAVGFGNEVEEGSWADVQMKGWRWVRLRVLRPYLPLWFLLLAGIVVGVDLLG